MNLSESPILRIVTLCVLYVAQGIPFGFVTIALAAYLSQRGFDVDTVGGLMSLGTLPWAFKWVWGPVIDRFGIPQMGRRRPWILLAQLMMAVTIAAMIVLGDVTTRIAAVGWMILLHNVFGSLQDVSVDALAIDLLKEHERGIANGLMYGSSYVGTMLGGFGLGLVIDSMGLQAALVVQVSMLLGIMMFPLLLRERPGERLLSFGRGGEPGTESPYGSVTIRGLFRSLARAFSLRSTLLGACVALGVKIGAGALSAVAVVFFIQELGWTQKEYSSITGLAGMVFGLMGSVVGGFSAHFLGPKRMAMLATMMLGLLWIGFSMAEPLWSYKGFVIGYVCALDFLIAMMSVALFALFMSISWPVVAATQFTAYMALLNLSNTIGTGIAGTLTSRLSVPGIFLCTGLFQIGLVVLLQFIDPRETRRVLHTPGDES